MSRILNFNLTVFSYVYEQFVQEEFNFLSLCFKLANHATYKCVRELFHFLYLSLIHSNKSKYYIFF